MNDSATLPEPGDTYAGFELLRRLGAGAFASVYEARAPAFAGSVALKLSRTPVVAEDVALRALREIGVMQTLTNDHVVHILDHGMGPDDRWYLVMEFLQGAELGNLHPADQPMAPGRAVDIVHQASLGMEEAHRAGIVHRDLKPDNLWVETDGNVKVLDFGLARSWDADTTIAATATIGHMLVGTPHYAQPEQIESGKLTPASDVYSLGVILYELLTGRTPLFPDEPISVVTQRLIDDPLKWLLAHVNTPFVPITRYPEGEGLPPGLVEIIHACLAKDPDARPSTAGVLARQLGEVLVEQFGKSVAATLHMRAPSGEAVAQALLPGNHRVGYGRRCEIGLPHAAGRLLPALPRLMAILEWSGPPALAELRPLRGDGTVTVNGTPVTEKTSLSPDDAVTIGDVQLRIAYPR